MKRQPIRHRPRTVAGTRKVTVTHVAPTSSPGDVVLDFGKFKGRTIAEADAAERGYVAFIAGLHREEVAHLTMHPGRYRTSQYAAQYLREKKKAARA